MYLQPVNRLPTPNKTVPLARPFSVIQRWLLCVLHSGSNQRCRMEQVWLQGSWKCIGNRHADSRTKMKGSMHCSCQKIMFPCGTCNCFLACFAYCVGVVKHRGPLPVTNCNLPSKPGNIYVAVPGRNRTLFCCVFPLYYRVRSAIAQYFR